jgi:hypothetical protein
MTRRGLLLVCFVVAGCSRGNGDTCRRTSDCASGLACAGPDDGPVCGIPPRRECTNDQSCSPGLRCHAIEDSCSAAGVGSMCDVPCTQASCGPGFRCNAGSACEPIPCDEGFACPSYQQCSAATAHDTSSPVYVRAHGCVNVSCMQDSGCAAGEACVNGFCQTGPGVCETVKLVP